MRLNPTAAMIVCALTLYAARDVVPRSQATSPPDSVAARFQTALRAMAWRPAARRLHPDALARLHRWVIALIEADRSGRTLEGLFPGLSAAEVRSLPAADVFVRAMGVMAAEMPGLIHGLVARDVEIIGAVEESPDLAHVVYRNTDRLGGAVPEMRVMTLKRADGDWCVLETEELDLIREALRGIAQRRELPPG